MWITGGGGRGGHVLCVLRVFVCGRCLCACLCVCMCVCVCASMCACVRAWQLACFLFLWVDAYMYVSTYVSL